MKREVFFTGTAADVDAFNKTYIGQNFEKDEEGFFFTTNTMHQVVKTNLGTKIYEDPYGAGAYAKNASEITGEGAIIYPVYLSMKNPLTMEDIVEVFYLDKENPFDGNHQQDFFDENSQTILNLVKEMKKDSICLDWEEEKFAVVFEPEQISFMLLENPCK